MSEQQDEAILTALERSFALKDVRRTGWQLRNVEDPETVAGHSWGVAMLVFLFAPDHIDRDRTIRMALIHDVAEAVVGDYPTRADPADEPIDPAEKDRLERHALGDELDGLDPETITLWEEYAARNSKEAQFCKDMDLIDTCLQALLYLRTARYYPDAGEETSYDHLDEFFATSEPRLSTERGVKLFELIRTHYEEVKANPGW
ncbi:MAG: HD domain-containing protein [Natronomonas sp.]